MKFYQTLRHLIAPNLIFYFEIANFAKCFTVCVPQKDDCCLSVFIGPRNPISFAVRKPAADNLLLMCRFDVNVF